MAVQLEAVEKAFETVKDLAGAKGSEGVTWKLANDWLISLRQLIDGYVKPLLMTDISTAIRIAQSHIESAVDTQEVFTPGAAAALKDEEKLKHFIARKQKVLAVLQCSYEPQQERGCGGGFRGGSGGFRGGGRGGRGGGSGSSGRHTGGYGGTGVFPFKGRPCKKCGKPGVYATPPTA
eukprot:2320303-Rhodomonas_salina.1